MSIVRITSMCVSDIAAEVLDRCADRAVEMTTRRYRRSICARVRDMHTADDSILSSLHCTCRFSSWSARKDVGARTDHHDVGSRLAASAFREDQKVRIARSLVNRFERNKSVDFHLACAIKLAARDESRDLVDVSRWWTIGCQRWHLFAHERVHACQRR